MLSSCSYWPNRFTEGLVIAALAVVALAIAFLVAWRRKAITRGSRNPAG